MAGVYEYLELTVNVPLPGSLLHCFADELTMLKEVVAGIIALLERMGSSHEKDVGRGVEEPIHVLPDEFIGHWTAYAEAMDMAVQINMSSSR